MRRTTAIAGAALTVALGGCGLGAGPAPKDVMLRVSDGFGTRTVREVRRPELSGETTVMRLLEGSTRLRAGDGGRFVTAIDGLAGGEEGAVGTRDWLYYVNGVIADRGAADVVLRDGDRVWWDRHEIAVARAAAVVGSFPAPFAGDAGATVGCVEVGDEGCRTALARLRAAGVRATAVPLARAARSRGPRLLVGPWAALRRDPAAARLQRGPRASGVLARPSAAGLRPLDGAGRGRPLLRRWGLVAATRVRSDPPTWIVTGGDGAAVARAAGALTERALAGRFAVAVDAGGRPRPLPEGGR